MLELRTLAERNNGSNAVVCYRRCQPAAASTRAPDAEPEDLGGGGHCFFLGCVGREGG